jgi:hypothetical protein
MKRVIHAHLNQTIHFQLKEDIEYDGTVLRVQVECEAYKNLLERKHTKYKLVDKQVLGDGSILTKIKKQMNHYDIGDYLN